MAVGPNQSKNEDHINATLMQSMRSDGALVALSKDRLILTSGKHLVKN